MGYEVLAWLGGHLPDNKAVWRWFCAVCFVAKAVLQTTHTLLQTALKAYEANPCPDAWL